MSTLLYSPLPPLSSKPPLHHPFSRRPPLDSIHAHKGGRRRAGAVRCRAELFQDAPFAAAIGACVLGSLVLPDPVGGGEEDDGGEGGSAMDSTDARFAVMAVLSCIPYFNWLSWVFAWLDTGKRRYLVYSIVYLAPYLRTRFSLSPDESWLPIASIVCCIVHVQLETSIKNGDIKTLDLFGSALKLLPPVIRKNDSIDDTLQDKSQISSTPTELPSAEGSENQVSEWVVQEDDKQATNNENSSDEVERGK